MRAAVAPEGESMALFSTLASSDQAMLVRQLAASPLFKLASRSDLARLLEDAEQGIIDPVDPEKAVCTNGVPSDWVFVLLQGQYTLSGGASVDVGAAGGTI